MHAVAGTDSIPLSSSPYSLSFSPPVTRHPVRSRLHPAPPATLVFLLLRFSCTLSYPLSQLFPSSPAHSIPVYQLSLVPTSLRTCLQGLPPRRRCAPIHPFFAHPHSQLQASHSSQPTPSALAREQRGGGCRLVPACQPARGASSRPPPRPSMPMPRYLIACTPHPHSPNPLSFALQLPALQLSSPWNERRKNRRKEGVPLMGRRG